jgi:hypothetical protein
MTSQVFRHNTRVSKNNLNHCVVFAGHKPYEEMQGIYANHDIMIFPSMRQE